MEAERLNMTPYDFRLQDEGTIVILHPCNDAAGDWLYEHIAEPQWWGGGVVIERRYVLDIWHALAEDGMTIKV